MPDVPFRKLIADKFIGDAKLECLYIVLVDEDKVITAMRSNTDRDRVVISSPRDINDAEHVAKYMPVTQVLKIRTKPRKSRKLQPKPQPQEKD